MSFFKCNFHSFKFEDTSFHWLGYSNIYEHSLRSPNCTFTFRHAGHSRLRARFQLNLPSMESFIKRSSLGSWSQPLVTLMSCTGFADHQPGSEDNDWTEFMAERVDLTIWAVCLVTHQWLWLRSHTEPWTNIKVASAHEGSAAPSVSEIWCICLRSWLPAQIDRGRCFLASFFFCKDDKMMSGRRSGAGETPFLHHCTFLTSIFAHLSFGSAVSLQWIKLPWLSILHPIFCHLSVRVVIICYFSSPRH